LPRDLALVERRELAAALQPGHPVEQEARALELLGAALRVPERLARERERVRRHDLLVLLVDRLEVRRRLQSRAGHIVLTRNLLGERLAFAAQTIEREPGGRHYSASRFEIHSTTRSA